MYDWCNYTISICRNPNDLSKYLYFQNENQKKDFLKSAIMKEDNYLIVDELTENIHVLDRVICSTPYFIQDNESSYKKALINTSIKQR